MSLFSFLPEGYVYTTTPNTLNSRAKNTNPADSTLQYEALGNNTLRVGKPRKEQTSGMSYSLDDIKPGTETREEVFDNKKVKITKTTTVEQSGGATVITIIEDSKYHTSKKTIKINPDGSQERRESSEGKMKQCKMPRGFSQKYLSTQVCLGALY